MNSSAFPFTRHQLDLVVELMLRIELLKNNSVYQPGEPIVGTAYWEFESPPGILTVCVNWRTEGKGDEDFFTALEVEWSPLDSKGKHPFRLLAPRAPLSLDGVLIRICWTLDFSCEEFDCECVVPFTLSYTERPVSLTPVSAKLGQ